MLSPALFADHTLARRLERAEGMANAASVESRARLFPASGAEWIEVSGTYALFDTPESPITQTFGLGMRGQVLPGDLDRIENFFLARRAAVCHEVSPLADASVWPLLFERRYAPYEFTSILFRELRETDLPPATAALTARLAVPQEADVWSRAAAQGWEIPAEMTDAMTSFMRTAFSARGVVPFVVEQGGDFIATGALNIQDKVALLAGASTVPRARGQGAQRALLEARLRFAAQSGCDVAVMGALPGSTSQRNAERSGFRIAYTRTKWRLSTPEV